MIYPATIAATEQIEEYRRYVEMIAAFVKQQAIADEHACMNAINGDPDDPAQHDANA